MKITGSRCQCPSCDEPFNRVSTFDKHRVGEFAGTGGTNTRRCLTPEEMQAKGWSHNKAGFWITSAGNWRPA